MWPGYREGNSRDPDSEFSSAKADTKSAELRLVGPCRAGQDANLAPPETRSPPPALVEVPQALPRGLWFRAFLQRATAAERVDLRGSELLPQDVETMWTTAARSDGRRRAMAGQAHRLLLVRPGRPRSCPLLWAAAAWLPVGCRWFVVFPLGGQKKWLAGCVFPREIPLTRCLVLACMCLYVCVYEMASASLWFCCI